MNKHTILLLFVLAAAAVGGLRAQTPVPDGQKYLQQFVGNWSCRDASIEMDGKRSTVEYHADFKSAASGTGLVMHEDFNSDKFGQYVGENIVGYDPNTSTIHWYSIDNTGTCHDHYGFWSNPKHLFVQYNGIADGKMYVEQLDMEFISTTQLHVKVTGMTNGVTNVRIEGTFMKVH